MKIQFDYKLNVLLDFITAHKKKSFLRKHKAIKKLTKANSESAWFFPQGNAWEQANHFPSVSGGTLRVISYSTMSTFADRQVILGPRTERGPNPEARGQRDKQQNPAIGRQECIHWEDESEWTRRRASWDPILKFPRSTAQMNRETLETSKDLELNTNELWDMLELSQSKNPLQLGKPKQGLLIHLFIQWLSCSEHTEWQAGSPRHSSGPEHCVKQTLNN